MLTILKFKKLDYQDKKKLLGTLFGQIQTEETSFGDVIFLLQASDSIKDSTLDGVYKSIIDLMKIAKDVDHDAYKEKLKEIQKSMQDASDHDAEEADALLENV